MKFLWYSTANIHTSTTNDQVILSWSLQSVQTCSEYHNSKLLLSYISENQCFKLYLMHKSCLVIQILQPGYKNHGMEIEYKRFQLTKVVTSDIYQNNICTPAFMSRYEGLATTYGLVSDHPLSSRLTSKIMLHGENSPGNISAHTVVTRPVKALLWKQIRSVIWKKLVHTTWQIIFHFVMSHV